MKKFPFSMWKVVFEMSRFLNLILCIFALASGVFFGFVPESAKAASVCLYDGRGARTGGMPDCPVVVAACGDQTTYINENDYWGSRLNTGIGQTPVDVHGICRYLLNNNTEGYFIPFRSSEEWSSFLTNIPAGLSTIHCARPFTGKSLGQGLYFGETSARFDMGDLGDPTTYQVSLPYWKTGSSWPSGAVCSGTSHTFHNTCYKEYPQYKCWKWVQKTCSGSSCDSKGKCTSYSYDCSYCADEGTICAKQWYSWSETFNFKAIALDSDTRSPSWSGESSRTGGTTRPQNCMIRCTFTGHDCVDCPNVGDCTPDGTTTCVDGRKIDSCGNDIGACKTCCCSYWGY